MAGLVAAKGQLVSFGSEFEVVVRTPETGAQLFRRQVPFADAPEEWQLIDSVPRNTEEQFVIPTPNPGEITQVRLLRGTNGSPDGSFVDELFIVRLNKSKRGSYLTACSEGRPQLALDTGGTFVRATVGSGPVESRGQLFLSTKAPNWPVVEAPTPTTPPTPPPPPIPFPTIVADGFLLSAVSDNPDAIHEIAVVDRREDGWTTNPRLEPGTSLFFIALVWDKDGGWDFTWTRNSGMPLIATVNLPPPDTVQTKERLVELRVESMVCLDDSDDLSDGEATFTITMAPSGGTPDVRTFRWKPMETGSVSIVNERFIVRGVEAATPTLSVKGVEDDSGSFPTNLDDVANSEAFRLRFAKGPGAESFTAVETLKGGPGSNDFHFLVNCSADVSYS